MGHYNKWSFCLYQYVSMIMFIWPTGRCITEMSPYLVVFVLTVLAWIFEDLPESSTFIHMCFLLTSQGVPLPYKVRPWPGGTIDLCWRHKPHTITLDLGGSQPLPWLSQGSRQPVACLYDAEYSLPSVWNQYCLNAYTMKMDVFMHTGHVHDVCICFIT